MKKQILALAILVLPCLAQDYTPSQCPVVGNTNSRIYHVAGGKFYAKMLRQNKQGGDNRKCFQTEEQAQKAGYRHSKR